MSFYPQVPNSLSHLKFKRIDSRYCYHYEDDNVSVLRSYNTIVALFVKSTKTVFIDEYKYSGYTSSHICVWLHRFVKTVVDKYICISQTHLIDTILKALTNSVIELDIRYRFNQDDYAKIYRLHGKGGKIVKIIKPSNTFYYAFRVDKNCKEQYLTPERYGVKLSKVDYVNYIPLKNLKPLEGGI